MNRNLPDTKKRVCDGWGVLVGAGERTFQAQKSMLAREEVMSVHDAFKKLSHLVA